MSANSPWTGSIPHWTYGARHQSVGSWLRAGILVYLSASRKLRDLQLSKLTRFDRFNGGLQQGSGSKDSAQIIRRKFQDRNPPATEVLLITDTLIGGDEQIELPFRQAQEFAVCDAFPTAIAYRYALVAGKAITHWYWQAFVQQDSHSYDLDSKAVSDRSKTRRAISRVTDGKQERNSSSV